MDSIIENLLNQFKKSYPISQVLCPYCIYNCSATAKYCSKFDLHSNKTTFQVQNKKFKIMFVDFTCCDNFNIKLAIQTFKQLYPSQIHHELFSFKRGVISPFFDDKDTELIEKEYGEVWTLFTACLSCSTSYPTGQYYIFVKC